MLVDVEERFYLKPDAGMLLLSPADETEMEPCDAYPDELDVAVAVDRVERATSLEVKHVRHKWAGLRSFVTDRSPVVGFDPAVPAFSGWPRSGVTASKRAGTQQDRRIARPRRCAR